MTDTARLTVYRHETLPPLAAALATTLDTTTYDDPLTPTVIAIPSFAVARWLTDRLASNGDALYGQATNLRTVFPGALIGQLLDAVSADDATGRYAPEQLTWTILSVLRRDYANVLAYAPLHAQLFPDAGSRSGVAFARHTAELFDRYMMHRPALLHAWSEGNDCDSTGRALDTHLAWQSVLWRSILANLSEDPPHVRRVRAIALLDAATPGTYAGLNAESYNVFGVHALHQNDLAVLAAVAQHRPVNLFLLTASTTWSPAHEPAPKNRFLDVFTRHSQAQHRQAIDVLTQAHIITLDAPLADDSVLAHLTRQLATDTPPPEPAGRRVIAANDDTVTFHACHGIVRECDAVKDHLLALLDADDTLQLRDIAILTPDLDNVAPLLAGVLADGDSHTGTQRNYPRLAFAIKDRAVIHTNMLADTIVALLNLAQSRVTVNEVSDLLQRELVATQLNLTDDQIRSTVNVLRDAGARWGIDGPHRTSLSETSGDAGSFAYAFDRIVLGFAVPNAGDAIVYDMAPHATVTTEAMQHFLTVFAFLTELFAQVTTWRAPRSLADWIDATVRLLNETLAAPKDAFERQTDSDTIARILGELANDLATNTQLVVSLAEYIDVFSRACAKHGVAGLNDTGITVSSLLGIRSLPFRVVCLVGMNDTALQRASTAVVHDLIATQPHTNDTTSREETRQLVFDALINATDHLILTYTATDPATGEQQPNARVLDDLYELIDAHVVAVNGSAASTQLTQTHRRQLTHPDHYQPNGLLQRTDEAMRAVSHAAKNAARETDAHRVIPARFAVQTPAVPSDTLSLQALIYAVQDPTRTFLYRHGIRVVDDEGAAEDRDLFAFDGLTRYAVYDQAMRWANDDTLERFVAALSLRGLLPTGTLGSLAQHDLHNFIHALRNERRRLADTPTRHTVSLTVADTTLTSEITRYGDTVVAYDASTNPVRSQLGVWLQILALTVATGNPHQATVMYRKQAAVDVSRLLAPADVAYCQQLLAELIDVCRHAQAHPTLFFANTSYAYAAKLHASGSVEAAKKAAESQWYDDFRRLGDATKTPVRYVYGQTLTFEQLLTNDTFHLLATKIFNPLLDAQTKAGT